MAVGWILADRRRRSSRLHVFNRAGFNRFDLADIGEHSCRRSGQRCRIGQSFGNVFYDENGNGIMETTDWGIVDAELLLENTIGSYSRRLIQVQPETTVLMICRRETIR